MGFTYICRYFHSERKNIAFFMEKCTVYQKKMVLDKRRKFTIWGFFPKVI